jgi:type I restriction enzyme M protein
MKARKRLRHLDDKLLETASQARTEIDPEKAQALVLGILKERLASALDRRVATHSRKLGSRYANWHDKYAVTLGELEAERDDSSVRLDGFLKGLGYE